ncbi:MAG: tRNA (adenosine(37)-N6)-dimethylallyltransferase MiaA [Chthoniobacterales bacterium]
MNRTFFIVGPTASGKSDLAADVAARCDAEIVSADAFQIYRGLPLLTAQPNEATLRRAPHHLVGTVALSEEMSADKFRGLALAAIEGINRRGKLAIVVGGSGLYLKALTHGLTPLPEIDPTLRAKLNALSPEELNAQLRAVDPSAAEKIDRRNKRRIVRALEIFVQTKKPASAQRSQWEKAVPETRGVFVVRDRAELCVRIDRRVEEMFRAGVRDEVARVSQLSATAGKAIGLEQVRRLLEGGMSEAECIATIQQATRRYAKRQLTWFRRQLTLEPLNLSQLKDHVAAIDWILQKVSLLRPLE